jgi:hypothetical protein
LELEETAVVPVVVVAIVARAPDEGGETRVKTIDVLNCG